MACFGVWKVAVPQFRVESSCGLRMITLNIWRPPGQPVSVWKLEAGISITFSPLVRDFVTRVEPRAWPNSFLPETSISTGCCVVVVTERLIPALFAVKDLICTERFRPAAHKIERERSE